ncbi:MAG: hypothetical protein ABT02_18230 [Comamonadaceae bacterium SCN 68-20]|nr:hypothetical protein [Comamonadaceae bacterium]ODU57196.1 MAG: hypothetical protein ABT02_18230 [Comamonadaceae bacterium SCN 68-20]OJX35492.1 MAG: hypothetical protein BGO75_10570 [Burkholderiales bacterium 68-20]
MVVILALALTIAGCMCLYLASPHQKWQEQAPPGRPLAVAAGVLLAGGLTAFIAAWRPLSGVFVTLHVAMLCLAIFPYVAALRAARRRG